MPGGSPRRRRPGLLLLCIAAAAAFVALLHWASPRMPGPAGEVFRSNRAGEIEASALFYTEVGPVREFLDRRSGRYAAPGRIPAPATDAPPPAP